MNAAETVDRRASAGSWAAVVVGNAAVGVIGAGAVVLWWATAYGVAARWGWTHPDPTLFDDGLGPWVMLAFVATGVDVVVSGIANKVVRRLSPVRPAWRRRLVAVVAHLAVAVGLAAAYLDGAFS